MLLLFSVTQDLSSAQSQGYRDLQEAQKEYTKHTSKSIGKDDRENDKDKANSSEEKEERTTSELQEFDGSLHQSGYDDDDDDDDHAHFDEASYSENVEYNDYK